MVAHWLPDRHLGVAATLAHVDELIRRVGEMLFDYQAQSSDVVRLREVLDGQLRHLVVESVAPIPHKIPLLAADALNALRASIEHTIYIEAEADAGAELSERAAKLVEMPAASSYDKFVEWTQKRAKNGPSALRSGADLNRRIYDLQPLHRYTDPEAHPLARLVAYTNHAKHRTPAVTAVRIPVVSREDVTPRHPRDMPKRPEEPLVPGEVIFSAPTGQVVPVTLFPTVGINLPGTARWPVLMNELGEIAAWVRTQAIPRLITGTDPPQPEIPAWHEISQGHPDLRGALSEGSRIPAYDRNRDRLSAATVRADMTGTIADMPDAPTFADVRAWLESLPDTDVLTRMRELVPSFDHDPDDMLHNWDVLLRMRDDAVAFTQRHAMTDLEEPSNLDRRD
ncbi:hypothetical protein [Brachybacterium alimentarium]|uniref:hypothetical protein n=1 Tax=Brachybacterium alimentarium TaxID=47845 RepID=UPI003FD33E1B